MIQLPVPATGRVRRIFHIADLHIRLGKQRFAEYEMVFAKFINVLRGEIHKDFVVCIAGDLFHNRQHVDAAAIILFLSLVARISTICPCWLIAGNHDIIQEAYTSDDLIQSLIFNTSENVFYMQESGHYAAGEDVGIGMVAIQDALCHRGRSGVNENLPAFPDPVAFPDSVEHKISLFHGTVPTHPLSYFAGYDLLLLGDLHVQQINNSARQDEDGTHYFIQNPALPCWTYPASMLQQNHGESVFGHGYNLVDLEHRTLRFHHINNNHGFISYPSCIKQLDETYFPQYVSVRTHAIDETVDEICRMLTARGKIVIAVMHKLEDPEQCTPSSDAFADISSYNTPSEWLQFARKHMHAKHPLFWERFVTQQATVAVPVCEVNISISNRIDDRNDRITRKINSSVVEHSPHQPFKLISIAWQHILCFGKDNVFNFSAIDGKIALINADNGQGKTSFLETTCIALFGMGFPSRTTKSLSASIMSNQRPDGEPAFTELILTIGETRYKIRRSFTHRSDDTNKIHSSKDTVIHEHDSMHVVRQGKTAVDSWIEEHVGGMQSFLLSCMITQSNDNDFFALTHSQQKALLDAALGIEKTMQFIEVLKESKQAHLAIEELTDAVVKTMHIDANALGYKGMEHNMQYDDSLMRLGKDYLNTRLAFLQTQSDRYVEECETPSMTLEIAEHELAAMKIKSTPSIHVKFQNKGIESIDKRILKKTLEHSNLMRSRPNEPIVSKTCFLALQERYGSMDQLTALIDKHPPRTVRPKKDCIVDVNTRYVNTETTISRAEAEQLLRHRAVMVASVIQNELLISQSTKHAYNPDCQACKAQPWKKHIDHLETHVRELQKSIASINQQDLEEYLEHINIRDSIAWRSWDQHNSKLSMYKKDFDTWKSFLTIDADVYHDWKTNEAECFKSVQELGHRKAQILRATIKYWIAYNANCELTSLRAAVAGHDEWSRMQHHASNIVKRDMALQQTAQMKTYMSYLKVLKERRIVLEELIGVISTFHAEVYTQKVLPMLLVRVNSILANMTYDRLLRLEKDTDRGWCMQDGSSCVPMGRASGFQKYIISMSMRLALGQIGASGIKPRQLFLDESFTSLDKKNLEKVPGFLKHLTSTQFYDSVVLVTHLDDLKICADVQIHIQRDADVSKLVYI